MSRPSLRQVGPGPLALSETAAAPASLQLHAPSLGHQCQGCFAHTDRWRWLQPPVPDLFNVQYGDARAVRVSLSATWGASAAACPAASGPPLAKISEDGTPRCSDVAAGAQLCVGLGEAPPLCCIGRSTPSAAAGAPRRGAAPRAAAQEGAAPPKGPKAAPGRVLAPPRASSRRAAWTARGPRRAAPSHVRFSDVLCSGRSALPTCPRSMRASFGPRLPRPRG